MGINPLSPKLIWLGSEKCQSTFTLFIFITCWQQMESQTANSWITRHMKRLESRLPLYFQVNDSILTDSMEWENLHGDFHFWDCSKIHPRVYLGKRARWQNFGFWLKLAGSLSCFRTNRKMTHNAFWLAQQFPPIGNMKPNDTLKSKELTWFKKSYLDSNLSSQSQESSELYWKDRRKTQPNVIKLLCRYRSVACTSIFEESCFSSIDKIFTRDRESLKDSTVEAMMFCKKNWPFFMNK